MQFGRAHEEATMAIGNGTSVHHTIDEQFDSLKSRIHDAVDRAETSTAGARSWIRGFAGKASELIKAHPFAAVGIAVGVGYAIVRFARRR
jgi:ElaB/YqjD/DUF883 family membrane-anchored ribosome-binding protein